MDGPPSLASTSKPGDPGGGQLISVGSGGASRRNSPDLGNAGDGRGCYITKGFTEDVFQHCIPHWAFRIGYDFPKKIISWHLLRNPSIVQSEVGVRNGWGSRRNSPLKSQSGLWTFGVISSHHLDPLSSPLLPSGSPLLPPHLALSSGLETEGRGCSGPCWQLDSLQLLLRTLCQRSRFLLLLPVFLSGIHCGSAMF